MKLKGLNAIITGANQGLGFAIASEYVKEGASVVLCARDFEKLKDAQKKLLTFSGKDQKIIIKKVDVSVENEVKNFSTESIKEFGRIDILVNNAGIYGPKGLLEDIDISEWIKAIEINLYSILFFSKYILPHMRKNKFGKIINLSGGGATNPLPRISSYAASKAAVVRLTETLSEEYKEFGIDINAVAPGALNTRLLDEVLTAGPEVVGKNFYDKALKQKESGGAPLDKGALLCTYLASAESNGITGKLISALWDPWEDFKDLKEELNNSDIYTLRRIVPEERNKSWGKK